MACFLVPAAEAIVTTVMTKVVKSKEKKSETFEINVDGTNFETGSKTPFSSKLRWLSNLLWGGSALLAFEHLWHGEIVPWFPFLSALNSAEETGIMLQEMLISGTAMAALITAIWGCMLIVSSKIEKRAIKSSSAIAD